MAVENFEANVRHRPGLAIIDLHGDINGNSEKVLNSAYAQAEDQNPAAILLNFTEVKYINSTGIALIVGLITKARRVPRRLRAYGLSAHYMRVFQITRMADFMGIFPDEAAALADVATSTL